MGSITCIGMWAREGAEDQKKNTIVHSFNRNFAKRADGNPNTHAFVGSSELVTAMAIAGDLGFNPLTDTLTNENGEEVKLEEPTGFEFCLLYTSPSPRDRTRSRMPSSA